MGIFKNAYTKVKGIVTGGSDTETENISKKKELQSKAQLTATEINFLHNRNAMMNNRKTNRRMRNKMRRATQQSQRS